MTGAINVPAAEVDVGPDLVRALLRDQCPALAEGELVALKPGWDNVIFRLGDDLLVRLPRRQLAAPLIEHEHRWLPELAARLPLPIPAPVHAGQPGRGYPWRWTVTRWIPGATALTEPLSDPERSAAVLGGFLRALHQTAPAGAPPNPYRGGPLRSRDDAVRERLEALRGEIDADGLIERWERALAVEPWSGPPVWLHGDLHPHNVVVADGDVAAVIDFGDITAGDPATDLAIAWMLLPPATRPVLREAAGADAATWDRGRGWALNLGLAYLHGSADWNDFQALGRRTLGAVLADPF